MSASAVCGAQKWAQSFLTSYCLISDGIIAAADEEGTGVQVQIIAYSSSSSARLLPRVKTARYGSMIGGGGVIIDNDLQPNLLRRSPAMSHFSALDMKGRDPRLLAEQGPPAHLMQDS